MCQDMTAANMHTKICYNLLECLPSLQLAHISLPQTGNHSPDSGNTILLLCLAQSITILKFSKFRGSPGYIALESPCAHNQPALPLYREQSAQVMTTKHTLCSWPCH